MVWIKRVIIFGAACSLLVLGLYGALLLALNAGLGPWVTQALAARVGLAPPGEFRCEHVTVTPSLRVTLHEVSLPLRDGREMRTFTVSRVAIETPIWEVVLQRHVALHAVNGGLSGPHLAVEGVEVRFAGSLSLPSPGTPPLPVGELQVASARLGQLAVTRIRGPIIQTAAGYRVDPLIMQAYSGWLQGVLTVELVPVPRLALDLNASDLALGDLASFNPAMFRGAQGTLRGAIQLLTTREGPASLQGMFAVDLPGGTIGSLLLQGLLPYLPRTVERERLRQVIAQGELVPFESGSVRVTVTDPQHMQAILNMSIPAYNLLLSDVTMDIRFESADVLQQLAALLGHFQ